MISGLFFIAGGLILIAIGYQRIRPAWLTEGWSEARGEVIDSMVARALDEDGRRAYYALVQYRYHIDGQKYVGNRVRLNQVLSNSAFMVRGTVRKYSAGQRVRIYYDPDSPSESVLIRGAGALDYIPFVLASGFLTAGTLLVLHALQA